MTSSVTKCTKTVKDRAGKTCERHKQLMNFQYAMQEMVNFDVQEIKPKQSFKSKIPVNSTQGG